MKLEELLKELPVNAILGNTKKEIKGIAYDSRAVKPDYIFICIKGLSADGHHFAHQAVSSGASTLIVEDFQEGVNATQILVTNTRQALAIISSKLYNYPAHKLKTIGITGTNGKTTTSWLTEAMLQESGINTGLIGTIHYKIGQKIFPSKNTTPESLEINQLFQQMLEENIQTVIIEVSSHALALERVYGIPFDVAVFTNLSRDHLDFHLTLEEYFQAKLKLFLSLHKNEKGTPWAIINQDDPAGKIIISKLKGVNLITYGMESNCQIRALDIEITPQKTAMTVITPAGKERLQLKLSSQFNIYNCLAVIGIGICQNIPLKTIKTALEKVERIPGRFEQVKAGQKFTVLIDYAHSPDGLQNLLKATKQFPEGRKILVFGCGGDRDKGKRPIMGAIAARYADFIIITSDNPRSEDPLSIIKEIKKGLKDELNKLKANNKQLPEYIIEEDRYKAIKTAIEIAQPKDIVIIAGKGHETYQIFKDRTIPFNDKIVAEEIIRKQGLEIKTSVCEVGGNLRKCY